nr:OLE1/tagRFP [Cloning vector pUbiCas9-Red]AVI59155.1 OLE1/tagRFP [Cloning vector pEciCas9-Red]
MADTARGTHHDIIGRDQYPMMGRDRDQYQMSGRGSDYSKSRQIAKAATAVTAGGSLLVLSSLTLVGTVIALTVATPLLVIFSPILVPALITVALLITGFLSSGGFGIAAITVFSWIYKYATGEHPQGSDKLDSARMKLGSKAQDLKDRAQYYGQQHTGGEHDRDRTRGGQHTTMSELIKENMHMKLYMEGTVNNHHFKCTSEGEGKPYEGTQTMRIKVVEGGPLPFAFDILATSFMYGSRTFINHTQGIPDFFKQSFPEGFTWERVTTYEDGGVLTATQDTSLQDGCLIYNVKIRGVNFPSNGPVMQKKTLGWEANTEMLYPADGGLEGRSDMALKLVGGGHLICNFKTTYRSKKPAKNLKMPGVYYVDHRLERIKEADKETYVEQHEVAVARYCDLPSKLGHK